MSDAADAARAEAVRIWEQLGPVVRAGLSTTDMLPERRTKDVMIVSNVETMTCTAHPLERQSQCSMNCCKRASFSLQSKAALQSAMTSSYHAAGLLAIFLKDPNLAYPPDIPQYALRAEKLLIEYGKLVELRKARKAKREAAEARREAKKQAQVALRSSYAYRIAQCGKKLEKVDAQIDAAIALRSRIEKRKGRIQRSISALTRAARKKGEPLT